MTETQKQLLLAYRQKALENRMVGNSYLKDRDIVLLLANALPTTSSLFIHDALKQDLKTRPLMDAIAAWCEPEIGISRQFPEAIIQIASTLVPLDK